MVDINMPRDNRKVMVTKVEKVTKRRAYMFCPYHHDINNPSLAITLTGEYRGRWRCFGCNTWGQLSEQQLKRLNMEKGKEIKEAKPDFDKLQKKYTWSLSGLGYPHIGLIEEFKHTTLMDFGIGWDGTNYTIPMYDENGICGIQLRTVKGNKNSITGSSSGIFRSHDAVDSDILYITEGCTDAMTLYDLGFNSIGKQSCNSTDNIVYNYVLDYHFNNILIMADNDKPGIDGANNLKEILSEIIDNIIIMIPPYNDVREWRIKDGCNAVIEGINRGINL